MKIVVDVSGYYEWEPVPPDVKVTDADVRARTVKPMQGGGYLMRVPRDQATQVEAHVGEDRVWAMIEQVYIRSGRIITRKEAAATFLNDYVMPQHAHRRHVRSFTVEDDHDDAERQAAMVEAFRAHLTKLSGIENARTRAPIIDPGDVDAIVEAYAQPTTSDEHACHMHAHFGVKQKGAAA